MAHGYETGRPTDESPTGIRTRDDFGQYLLRVLGDYQEAGATEWENNTLERFLDGLAAFALARVHGQSGQEDPSWRLFAEIIAAATGYEQPLGKIRLSARRSGPPMTEYGWVLDRTHSLAPAACVTLVHGASVEEVLAGFGVDPGTQPQPLADLRDGPRPCVAVAVVEGGVAAVEPNGFQGSRPEVLRRVSGRGSAASVFWNVNLASRFGYAEAGELAVAFDPLDSPERWGIDPHRFGDPQVAVMTTMMCPPWTRRCRRPSQWPPMPPGWC